MTCSKTFTSPESTIFYISLTSRWTSILTIWTLKFWSSFQSTIISRHLQTSSHGTKMCTIWSLQIVPHVRPCTKRPPLWLSSPILQALFYLFPQPLLSDLIETSKIPCPSSLLPTTSCPSLLPYSVSRLWHCNPSLIIHLTPLLFYFFLIPLPVKHPNLEFHIKMPIPGLRSSGERKSIQPQRPVSINS